MIRYHVIGLLCLVVAAVAAIEAAFRFTMTPEGFSNPLGWLMCALFAICILVYIRARKFRKKVGGF
jgi:hypothetical protein